jgi:hypothetical protein
MFLPSGATNESELDLVSPSLAFHETTLDYLPTGSSPILLASVLGIGTATADLLYV